ncbi:MAG: leucine--tRNA ligase [Dehalococcoidia bacterium]
MTDEYLPSIIEPAWSERWQAEHLYRTPEYHSHPMNSSPESRFAWQDSGDADPSNASGKKFYCLDFFPYPSGDGLSVGHCRNYVPTDVIARYRRMRGEAVLHPMGWDAFGLPAENEAILKGLHPRATVPRYAANYRRQLTLVGCSYDWEREINSSDPEYYRWTQWFFLYLYKRGLAYRAAAPVNWCPKDRTVLANEEVEDGRCWRCGSLVERRDLPQWFFRITVYADRLLAGLETLDWPEPIIAIQSHWIGRSEGVEFSLEAIGNREATGNRQQATAPPAAGPEASRRTAASKQPGSDPTIADCLLPTASVTVFTTRPDTVGGVTFIVLAPEHPLVAEITTAERRQEVADYVQQARRRPEAERTAAGQEQSGIFTGAYVRHPLNGAELPVYVAGYVLAGHGTGAIMAVPAHDERDFALAKRYGLPILPVIQPPNDAPVTGAYTGEGVMINSGELDGQTSQAAGELLTRLLEAKAGGQRRVAYRMRDWLISRQRYWGAPIPIVFCRSCGEVPVPEADLPVRLPEIDLYQPSGDGRSPLATVPEWVQTTCPQCGGAAERETDTMGGFACSSWYFLRFASPHEQDRPFDPEAVRSWLPVDLYVGGAEHAVLHLLYARFWTKVMHHGGLIDFDEPFQRLRNQGVVHAADGRRMSKSRGNVITPDSVVEEYGADALRTYLLFLAPFDQNVIWREQGIRGLSRWLARVWELVLGEPVAAGSRQPAVGDERSGTVASPSPSVRPPPPAPLPQGERGDDTEVDADLDRDRDVRRALHQTIKRVTADLDGFRFNTMIAALMEFTTVLTRAKQGGRLSSKVWQEARDGLLRLLAPSAPFITEELWHRLGHTTSIHHEAWPNYDPKRTDEEEVTLVVQVNGKVRERLVVPAGLAEDEALARALASPRIATVLAGGRPQRVVYRQDRILNLQL